MNAKTKYSSTALDYAAEQGHLPVIQALVSAGADVNAKPDLSYTALHEAARDGRLPLVQFLVSPGADVNNDNWILFVKRQMAKL